MAKQTLAKIENTTSYTINGVKIDLPTQQGWYLDFNLSAGERVNLDPQIIYGGVNIVTNTPSNSTSCDVGGTSNVYQLNVCTGEPLTSINVGPPNSEPVMVAGQMLSNSAAAVGSILITLPKGNARQITTNANGSMTDSAVHAAISAPATRGGWRRVRE
jgi:type IV pilus assembly protein PilY1